MRRCTTMLSTDPSYDNRTIASTLKMQIRTVQHAQGNENKVSGYGYSLWCGFKWGPHYATSHLRSRLESQHRDPGLVSEGVLRLCTLLSLALFLPQLEPAGLLIFVIRWEHHQHDLPQHQSQPDHCHPLSYCRHSWKRHAPSSGSVLRWWLRLKAATLNWCQLYYIIKLPELIFSIKVLK